MKTSSYKYRAGNVKCKRCRNVFNRVKGTSFVLCEHCRTHCSRCDVLLTDENRSSASRVDRRRGGKRINTYRCNACNKECANNGIGRDSRLVKTYGITSNEYDALLKSQNGTCWICHKPPVNNRLNVDHKHVLNDKKQNPRETRTRVRGLLCWSCNAAISKFKDDPTLLRSAAEYLEKWPAQEILNELQELSK